MEVMQINLLNLDVALLFKYKDKKSGYNKILLKNYKLNLIKQLKARKQI